MPYPSETSANIRLDINQSSQLCSRNKETNQELKDFSGKPLLLLSSIKVKSGNQDNCGIFQEKYLV